MKKNTKRNTAALVLTLAVTITTLQGYETSAASLKLNKKKLTLTKGKSSCLKVKGTAGKVTWKSSNKKVASVTKNGKVVAKKAGTATITAKVKRKKLTCKVTVTAPTVSQTPAPTQSPSATQKPVTTQKPITTQKPVTTQKPITTQAPVTTQKPSSDSVTEESAYATLNSLRSTYPQGMRLTNSYYYYSPRFGNGYGCYGFAAKLSDTVFGTSKAYQTHSDFSKIKVGDNIRIGNYHSVIVLTKSTNAITVVEGNYNSSVNWDRKITSSSLSSSGFKVYTRY